MCFQFMFFNFKLVGVSESASSIQYGVCILSNYHTETTVNDPMMSVVNKRCRSE